MTQTVLRVRSREVLQEPLQTHSQEPLQTSMYQAGAERKALPEEANADTDAPVPKKEEHHHDGMNELIRTSAYCGVVLSLGTYFLGSWLKKKLKWRFLNPLLLSILFTVVVLLAGGVDYDSYNQGAKYLSYLLTPATVCLAVPLYEQFEVLKKNWQAVLAGILAGVGASLLSILAMAVLFSLGHEEYVTFLPKSITTAIGMGVSEELGGYVPVTVAVIIITGVLGNVLAEPVLRLFRIQAPVAKGIALGTASHAIGTTRAMEMGEVEGAMGSLSIVVSGVLTVAGASLFALFW